MPIGILIFSSVVVLFHIPLRAVLLIWKDRLCYAKGTAAFLMFTETRGMSKVALINVIMVILLLLLLLLFELLSPKGWPIEASQQAWRYFKPGSQATLQYILFGWELFK